MAVRYFAEYMVEIQKLIAQALDVNAEKIENAAEMISACIYKGKVLYVFGPSHAGLMAQDLFYRAGGLLAIEPILPEELMLNVKPITRTSEFERQSGFAARILNGIPLENDDVLLIISVSGRNAVVTEMASIARAKGVTIIALTNLNYSKQIKPRSGDHNLFELADIVIDLPGVYGDAIIEIEGIAQKAGPTSTSVGSAILQGLMVEVAARLNGKGFPPPILRSANLDDGDIQNKKMFDEYRAKVSYL